MSVPFSVGENSDILIQKLTKRNLGRVLLIAVVTFVTPYVLSWYLMLIFSLSLLEPIGWIYETFASPLLFGFSVVFGGFGTLLLYNRWEEQFWEHYFSELIASVFVLTATLGLILLISGTAALKFSTSTHVPLENTDVLFLVIFLSFGLLLANIRAVIPVLKSVTRALISAYRARFVPPYTELNVKASGLNRPRIDNRESTITSLRIGIISAASVLVLAQIVLWMGNFVDLIQGHLNLLGYLRDMFSGDPEKVLDGSFGALKEIANILDLQILFLYLLILVFSYTYAANAIYFTRLGIERVRVWFGVSRLTMTALAIPASFFLLYVSARIAAHLFLIAFAIISVELASIA